MPTYFENYFTSSSQEEFVPGRVPIVHSSNDASQTSEPNGTGRDSALSDAMWRGNGGWEIAATPVLLGALGWLLDGSVGTRPLFTILGAVIGLLGAVANQYYRYVERMAVVTEERAAAREAKFGTSDGPRFAPREVDELPSYVVESDLTSNDRSSHMADAGPGQDVQR